MRQCGACEPEPRQFGKGEALRAGSEEFILDMLGRGVFEDI